MLTCLLQQAIISIAHQLVVSLLVAQVVCAADDSEIRTRLLSSTLFMTGFTTLLMVTLGSRYSTDHYQIDILGHAGIQVQY